MNAQERSNELQRLANVLLQVNKQLENANESSAESNTELKNNLAGFWENTGRNIADTAQFIEAIHRQKGLAAITEERRRQLERMADSPYFGRIDFREQDTVETEQIYIGISTLTDEATGRLLVYDWRTPVAGMFYDFERGEAWYDCPAGKITGSITLKRQYKIANGTMVYLFDSDLKIDDEMLQELLSKNVDEQMHTIVTSIQREQNQIIRNEGRRAVFVRGPAGSGKTSIALHRIAFLLYRERNSITSQNVLILSPNHIFSEYIASVLPEIGEANVLRMTFHDCISATALPGFHMEGRNEHLERLYSHFSADSRCIRTAGISYKSSVAFHKIISNYIEFIGNEYVNEFPAVELAGQILLSREEWRSFYSESYSFLPPAHRLTKIHELIQRRMQPIVHSMRLEKVKEISDTGEEINPKTVKVLARIETKRKLEPLYRQIELLTAIDPLKLYQRLFIDDHLFCRLAAGVVIPAEWPAIKQQTLHALRNGLMQYEDTFPVLFLQGMLTGFAVKREIKHLVIDEAQDYTTIQYAILAQLFPNCSWTILGDPAQVVHPFLQTADFETVATIIAKGAPALFQLQRSYRSTRQIQAFCQALLPPAAKTESIQRDGPLPRVIRIHSAGLMSGMVVQEIRALQNEGQQFIAIIGKTVHDCRNIYKALSDQIKLSLITDEEDEFRRGVIIAPAYLAKGLEFDSVLIPNADSSNYGSETDRHLLYTICTRALHRLILFHYGELSPLISAFDPQLYLSK